MVINGLISSMSTVLEMKSGQNLLCTFIDFVNRVVSGKNFTLPPVVTTLTNITSDFEYEKNENMKQKKNKMKRMP